MTEKEVISLVNKARENFVPDFKPESLKGARFNDNNKVMRAIRMKFYEIEFYESLIKPLPKIEQVPDKWIRDNINKILNDMAYTDYHYNNKEKWL
jgi:hypothetical protein